MGTTRSAIAELVATFAVVLVAAGAAVAGGFGLDANGTALAYGFVVAAVISSTAHLRAGQANPAVTLGLWVAGRIATGRAAALVLAQVTGAVAAASLLRYVAPGIAFDAASGGTPAVATGIAPGKAIVIEAVATSVVMFVYAATVIDPRGARARLGGLWVGFAVAAMALVFAPSTGAAVNPARWLGPAVLSGTWTDWYVWLVGPLSGAVLAAVAYASVFLHDEPLEPP